MTTSFNSPEIDFSNFSHRFPMNHLLRPNQWLGSVTYRVFRGLLYSTKTSRKTLSSNSTDSLRHRVIQTGDPRASIIPVLNQWVHEGKNVDPNDLQWLIRHLRHTSRLEQALEMSEWMIDEMRQYISPEGISTQLELISKVHGLEQAEKYFNSIPEKIRPVELYSVLLNCYAKNKCLEKAEATMQKIRELGSVKSASTYNVMLELYAQLRRHDKVDIVIEEMEEKGINFDATTFHNLLNAYTSNLDIEGMEQFLIKIGADPRIKVDWQAFAAAVNRCLEAGLTEKTVQMLRRAEQLVSHAARKVALLKFLTLYAACGAKEDVYRLWNLHRYRLWNPFKKMESFDHSSYACTINALVKMDDFDGAERIFEDWKSICRVYDAKVPDLLICAYCKRGLLQKAESLVHRLVKNGNELGTTAWSALASGYYRNNEMEKAVAAAKKSILAGPTQFKPSYLTWVACVEYLEGQGRKEDAEDLLKLLKEHGYDKLADRIIDREANENAPHETGGNQTLDGEKPRSDAEELVDWLVDCLFPKLKTMGWNPPPPQNQKSRQRKKFFTDPFIREED